MYPFASQVNFLDPVQTEEGKPYGPYRYKELVKERYLIAKNINTSYLDTGKMTPVERRYILQFLQEEAQKQKEMLEEIKQRKSN